MKRLPENKLLAYCIVAFFGAVVFHVGLLLLALSNTVGVTTGIGMYLVCPSWLLNYITPVCAHQAGSQLLVDGVYEHIATNYRLSCASKKYLIRPRAN